MISYFSKVMCEERKNLVCIGSLLSSESYIVFMEDSHLLANIERPRDLKIISSTQFLSQNIITIHYPPPFFFFTSIIRLPLGNGTIVFGQNFRCRVFPLIYKF